ncbi:MAG: class I SAM-dependent methyltransferase [Moorea sp. SIO3G5]|nr:class I SAM-dependent methyltransferase [Moorena sp. SIO3G5]NEQ85877.1 class I SAM-dependent methyltransferase [Moorena sp. SIO2I5]
MTAKIWNIWNESGGPKYPHEKVIQFCFRRFYPEIRSETKVLDLGCGSGVHCIFLAREGFQVTGTDISEIGVANTKEKLSTLGLKADIYVEAADLLNFAPSTFDCVICIGVYDSAGYAVAKNSIPRVSEILKKGGCGFFLFASDRDFRVKGENPLGLHGYSQNEVEEIFGNTFSKVYIDRYITTYQNRTIEENDWLITVEK